jgi:hypothetical protein
MSSSTSGDVKISAIDQSRNCEQRSRATLKALIA